MVKVSPEAFDGPESAMAFVAVFKEPLKAIYICDSNKSEGSAIRHTQFVRLRQRL